MILPLFLAMFSCAKKDDLNLPVILLNEQKMVDVMTDAQIVEADLNYRKSMGEDIVKIREDYYDQLFKHYGLSDRIFSENIVYYTEHPAKMELVMEQVVKRLVDEQNEWSAQREQEQKE